VADWQETVRDAMKRRGMTRKQLARELGINTTTVGRWLNGCGDPTPRALHHIGTILGLRLIGTGPADNDRREEHELLDAFRRMPPAEQQLLLQCLRERNLHPGSQDDEDLQTE
jgi:transcriptional regulator with XRE-family HTH domain